MVSRSPNTFTANNSAPDAFSLMASGDGRPVAQSIKVVVGFRPVRPDRHSARDPTDVRMCRVNSAVYHSDADALAPVLRQGGIVQPQLTVFPFFHL